MKLRLLRNDDLPALMRLKESAGWNQTEEDWTRLLDIQPDGCFGIEDGGEIVASATAVLYGGTLAWIGMVLTLPEFRGRGLARQLMERCIEFGAGAVLRLDASDMGLSLYKSLGFVEECSIERWVCGLAPPASSRVFTSDIDYELDRECFRADRSRLLRLLSRKAVFGVPGEGYAMARPGSNAEFFGPCISKSPAGARAFVGAFLTLHAGRQVCWDLFPHHPEAVRLAREFGFEPVRTLTRMVRGGPVQMPDERIYAGAGFEWG